MLMISRMFDTVTPVVPLKRFWYRCDKKFHLDDVICLFQEPKQHYGLILVSGSLTQFWTWTPEQSQVVRRIKKVPPSQHKTGGQSAQRFDRLYSEWFDAYVAEIVDTTVGIWTEQGQSTILGVVVAGPGLLKKRVIESKTYKQYFESLTLDVVTTPEIDEGDCCRKVPNRDVTPSV